MTPIDGEEMAKRAEDVRRIRHSTVMEGGRVSDATQADQDEYARGEIDESEMLRRVRARHDLPQQG